METEMPNLEIPSPADFDAFLPRACCELSVNANVVVRRAVQKHYMTPVTSDRGKGKLKTKSRPPSPTEIIVEEKPSSASVESVEDMGEYIKIESVYDAHNNLVQIKFLNNRSIPRQIMKIIGLVLPFHKHLSSIVINSGLRVEAMYDMANILPMSQITELCLDHTFLAEANYSVLLGQNHLKHLSISKCKINDTVVKTIASKLIPPCPASHTLSAINMATNRITDLGAKHLAEALRSNRHLSYLNLADNLITDNGAINILNVLMDFALTEQEKADARRKYVSYLKEYNDAMVTIAKEIRTEIPIETEKKSVKRKSMKSTGNSTKRNKIDKDNLSFESKRLSQDTLKVIQSDYSSLSKIMGPFIDVFSPTNTVMRNDATYCYGNNSLCYLNLAYNNLTYFSIKKLYEVLLSQKFHARIPKGLINIRIEGNFLPIACQEYQEIDDLIGSGLRGMMGIRGRMSDIIRKRASNYSRTASD